MKQWIIYVCLGIFSLVVLAIIVRVAYKILGRRRAARDFPPPGKMVDIGGRRIQLDCRGTGSPTVIFESGLDICGSLSWSAVHDEIAKTTRACAYSRAGIMWSDTHDAPQNAKSIAEDLHATLSKAGEQGPFVLVGHSMGGPYIMTYTKYFGAEVAGLVFVDAAHPEQVQRLNTESAKAAMAAISESRIAQLRNIIDSLLLWLGVVRAPSERMPNMSESNYQAIVAYASTSLDSYLKEAGAMDQSLAEAGTFRQLGDRPLFVLTSTAPFPKQALADLNWTEEDGVKHNANWKQMHEEQATWSTQSQHQLVPNAGHQLQFDRPDIVIAAVRSVVEKVRANGV